MRRVINLALAALSTLLDAAPLLILGGVCMWMLRTNQTGTTVIPMLLALGGLALPMLAEPVDRLLQPGEPEPGEPQQPQIEEGREHS